jgi:TonB-dependent starch-binding outer membrane protein SusC
MILNAFNTGVFRYFGLPPKLLMIMKLIIVLLTTCLMQVSAAGFAQRLNYSKKNTTLEEVFKQITLQTGYNVLYSPQKIEESKKIDVNFKNTDLKDALDQITKNQKLEYTIDSKNIIIKPEEPGFIENIIARFQAIDVRGVVIDENNQYLAGATVRVKGGKGTALTSTKGEFFIRNVEEGATLEITYIGYKLKEVKAVDDVGFVKLELSDSKLDEVQIMAYGRTNRRLSTSTIDGISAKDIEKQNINNPLLALQARIPGLNIAPSNGTPNAAVNIRIRGQNSIVGRRNDGTITTEPLIIIDGIPYENNIKPAISAFGVTSSALSFLNPSDIASIDVLKDADATSIYGSRGANGVILITTKKGKAGDSRISIEASSGFGEVAKKMDVLNTEQYLEMRREAFENDGIDFNVAPYNSPSLRNQLAPDLFVWDPNRNTDWQEVFWGGKAKTDQIKASISGGATNFQYLFNLGYNHQGYILPGSTNYDNATGRLNITASTPNQKLRVSLNTGYTNNRNKTLTSLPSVLLTTNAPAIYNEAGQLNWAPNPVTGFATWQNPYFSMQNPKNSTSTVLNFNVDLQYQITTNLTFNTLAGLSELKGNFTSKTLLNSVDPKRAETQGNAVRTYTYNTNSSISRSFEPQLQYQSLILKGRFTALIGGTLQYQKSAFVPIVGTGFASDALIGNMSAATTVRSIGQSSNEYKYNALFGRVSYNWEDKYLVNFNIRRDGSSRFGPNRQFGNFGSLAGAWVFTNETFMKSLNPILSFGKLRSSYGTTGSDRIGDYKFLENYVVQGDTENYQGVKTLGVMGVANPYYSWETVKKLEFGLDLGFLSDRINLSSAYFRNRSSNQLGRQFLPLTAGNSADSFVANQTAQIENSGWEFMFNTVNVDKKNFKWSSSINFSYLKNRVLALPTTGFFIQSFEEDPIGKPFIGLTNLFTYRGINQSTGLYQFEGYDEDGDGLPENSSTNANLNRTIYINPNRFGAITNSLSLYGFSLDFTFQFTKQLGLKYLFSNPAAPGTFPSSGTAANQLTGVLKRWQKTGDVTDVQKFFAIPASDAGSAYENAKRSDLAYEDASFIRLKNASLSYTFPKAFLTKTKLENLRMYLQGQNLLTITKYQGLDPEILGDVTSMPQLRVFTVGFQVLF